ncbi:MAG: hypothetical protein ACR2NH_02090 [Solirubrobacteraceae bacterium]
MAAEKKSPAKKEKPAKKAPAKAKAKLVHRGAAARHLSSRRGA